MNLRELFSACKDPDGLPVGTRIHLITGRVLLVGDVNRLGGVCDDCTDDDEEVEVAKVEPPDGASTRGRGE